MKGSDDWNGKPIDQLTSEEYLEYHRNALTTIGDSVVIVYGDDWEGVYVNGELAAEGHVLTPQNVLACVGIRAQVRSCNEDWLHDEGALPISIGDVVFE